VLCWCGCLRVVLVPAWGVLDWSPPQGCVLVNMVEDGKAAALAEVVHGAAGLRGARLAEARAMAQLRAAMLAADAAGVARVVIIERSGLSSRTAYKMFPVVRPSEWTWLSPVPPDAPSGGKGVISYPP
jgi:hypothetical protein